LASGIHLIDQVAVAGLDYFFGLLVFAGIHAHGGADLGCGSLRVVPRSVGAICANRFFLGLFALFVSTGRPLSLLSQLGGVHTRLSIAENRLRNYFRTLLQAPRGSRSRCNTSGPVRVHGVSDKKADQRFFNCLKYAGRSST
jgi:hypothetical protein